MARRKNSRAASGAGSIRQRSDGTWEGRFTVGTNPATGKPVRKSVYGKTQAEVRKKMTERLKMIDEGNYHEPSKLTVSQWLDEWMSVYKCNLAPKTREQYDGYIKNRIKPALGRIALGKLSATQVQRFYNDLSNGERAVKPKTVSNIHGILHGALKKAVDLEYIPKNVAEKCVIPKVEKAEIEPFTHAEMMEFLQAIKGHKYEHFYIVALFTGMRLGELLGLSWRQIDFEKGVIVIDQQLQRVNKTHIIKKPKHGKSREIAPASLVMDTLRAERYHQLEMRMRNADVWKNEMDLVFTNEIGGHYVGVSVFNCFRRICTKLGRPDMRVHDLRHTYAVNCLQAGDDFKTLQSNLGHHSAAFTLDRYAHFTQDMQRASAARMDAFIEKLG